MSKSIRTLDEKICAANCVTKELRRRAHERAGTQTRRRISFRIIFPFHRSVAVVRHKSLRVRILLQVPAAKHKWGGKPTGPCRGNVCCRPRPAEPGDWTALKCLQPHTLEKQKSRRRSVLSSQDSTDELTCAQRLFDAWSGAVSDRDFPWSEITPKTPDAQHWVVARCRDVSVPPEAQNSRLTAPFRTPSSGRHHGWQRQKRSSSS